MEINYKIIFFSDWHCGSGLAKGSDVDALTVKDKDGLPYVPGKTVKGLLREALESIAEYSGNNCSQSINELFGFFDDKDKHQKGSLFFSNAVIPDGDRKGMLENGWVKFLYGRRANTAIEGGTAKRTSLRASEVCMPCTLEGKILDLPSEMKPAIENGMRFIKRLGVGRNRGLGRCKFEIINTNE